MHCSSGGKAPSPGEGAFQRGESKMGADMSKMEGSNSVKERMGLPEKVISHLPGGHPPCLGPSTHHVCHCRQLPSNNSLLHRPSHSDER